MSGGAMFAGAATGVAEGIVNNMFAKDNAQWSLYQQKRLMDKANAMQMANVRSAPQAQVEGLRMAGFNPAMVSGAGTNSAPTVSTPNADMPQTIPFEFDSGAALASAQADKLDEETRALKLTNDQIEAANDAAVRGMLDGLNREQEDLEKALAGMQPDTAEYNKARGRVKEIESMKNRMTDPSFRGALGIAKGTEAAKDFTKHRLGILHEYLNGALSNAVVQKKLENGTVDALAGMDKAAKSKLDQDIEHVKQLIAESESKEGLNDQQVNMLATQMEQIGDQVLRGRLNDETFVRDQISDLERKLKADPSNKELQAELELWKSGLENLTDTEFRKLKYDIGKGVITGVTAGGAAGAVGSFTSKIFGAKNSKELGDTFDKAMETHKRRSTDPNFPGIKFKTIYEGGSPMSNEGRDPFEGSGFSSDKWNRRK